VIDVNGINNTEPGWVDVSLPVPITFQAGQKYHILVRMKPGSDQSCVFGWGKDAISSAYSKGYVCAWNSSTGWVKKTAEDTYFRLTVPKAVGVENPALMLSEAGSGDVFHSLESGGSYLMYVQAGQRVATSITLPSDNSVGKISLFAKYVSGYPTPLEVRIEKDNNGHPSGELVCEGALAQSEEFNDSAYAWRNFEFTESVKLLANTKYHLLLKLANESTSGKYGWYRCNNNNPYSGGWAHIVNSTYPNGYAYPNDDMYFRLYDCAYAESGQFISQPIELKPFEYISLKWNEYLEGGTDVTVAIRSGDSLVPDETWSDWLSEMTDPEGSYIGDLAAGRYLQYRVSMTTDDPAVTPKLYSNGEYVVKIVYDQVKAPQELMDEVDTYNNLIESRMLAGQETYKLVYKDGDIDVSNTADGLSTYYVDGQVDRVEDKDSNVIIKYTYNDSGDLINVSLPYPREELDRQIALMQDNIANQQQDALTELQQSKESSLQSITDQIAKTQDQIDFERENLQKYVGNPNYDQASINKAFSDLDAAQAKLDQNALDALADVEAQVSQAEADLQTQTEEAFNTLLNHDRIVVLEDIAVKETIPLVYFYYRKVLGRDANEEEVNFWAVQARDQLQPVSYEAIVDYLENSGEFAQRTASKDVIVQGVTASLSQYLDPAQKDALVNMLGIEPEKLVELTQGDVDEILAYLESRSLHFADSAYKSLKVLLDDNNIACSNEELAGLALVIDIITGVITPQTEGKLLLSMHALTKAAAVKGLVLYNTNLTFDNLVGTQKPVIVHVDGDHFVTVTDVYNETVTYIESNKGPEGEVITESKEEFLSGWQGYCITQEQPQDESKLISDIHAMNIRGAGWWSDLWDGIKSFFKKYWHVILPIVFIPLMPTLLGALSYAIQGIGTSIGGIFTEILAGSFSFAPAISSVMTGIGTTITTITTAVGGALGMLGEIAGGTKPVNGVSNKLAGAAAEGTKGVAMEVGAEAAQQSLLGSIAESVKNVAITIGVNEGISELNIDPTIANIASAFLSGGLTNISSGADFMEGAIRSGTIESVRELGEEAGIDSSITGLAAIAAGTLTSGTLDGKSVQEILKDMAPSISGELAYIGVQEIGEELGLDPRITDLAGISIRSSLRMGFSSGGGDPGAWLDGALIGLQQGALTLGVDYLINEMDINPLLASVGINILSGAMEGILSKKGIFEGIKNNFESAFLPMFNPNSDPWSQAVYISQILDFSGIVKERGFINALEIYAEGMFTSSAVNSMIRIGGTVGNYFNDLINNNQYEVGINAEGLETRKYAVVDEEGNVLGSLETFIDGDGVEKVYRINKGGLISEGSFGVDSYGNFGLIEGQNSFFDELEDFYYKQQYSDEDGYVLSFLKDGQELYSIESDKPIGDGASLMEEYDFRFSTPWSSFYYTCPSGGEAKVEMEFSEIDERFADLLTDTANVDENLEELFDGEIDVDALGVMKEYFDPSTIALIGTIALAEPTPIGEIGIVLAALAFTLYAKNPRLRPANPDDLGPLKDAVGLSGAGVPDPNDPDDWDEIMKKPDNWDNMSKWEKFKWYSSRVVGALPHILQW
jgi:hypothetical protein